MALLSNTIALSSLPGSRLGGDVALSLAGMARAERRNFAFGWHTPNATAGIPNGHLHPSSWRLPLRGGGMSAYTSVTGSGGATASGAAGINMQATLVGSGDIASALATLVVSMQATLSGSGGISTAAMVGIANMAATLSGSGVISQAQATALANMVATLSGSGQLTGTARGTASMAATLRGYGDLTPEGLRDAVWAAPAAANNTAGTMGQKLNSAASGGVDYPSMAAAVRTELQAELLRIIEIAKLHGLVIGSDLVVTETTRTAGTVAQSINTTGGTTTVQRQP